MNVLVVLMVLTCVFSAEAQLNKLGVNVCHRVEQQPQTFLFKTNRVKVEEKRVDCWDWMQNFRCLRKFYVPVYETRTRIVHVPVFYCCPGSDLIGSVCVKRAPTNVWTDSPSGCSCYFNHAQDCACCVLGGCQCDWSHPDKCVQCGYGNTCSNEIEEARGIDAWTLTETGCSCLDGSKGGDCPCCLNRGCPCREGRTNRCSQCGLPQACKLEA